MSRAGPTYTTRSNTTGIVDMDGRDFTNARLRPQAAVPYQLFRLDAFQDARAIAHAHRYVLLKYKSKGPTARAAIRYGIQKILGNRCCLKDSPLPSCCCSERARRVVTHGKAVQCPTDTECWPLHSCWFPPRGSAALSEERPYRCCSGA